MIYRTSKRAAVDAIDRAHSRNREKVSRLNEENDRLRARLERAEKILRDWQRFTQDTERMSTAEAVEAGAPDYYQDMIAERDAFLRGD